MNAEEPRAKGPLQRPTLSVPRRFPVGGALALARCVFAVFCVSCSAAGSVDGVVEQGEFTIRDPAPGSRWVHEDLVVMMSEDDGTLLRVASLRIPNLRDASEDELILHFGEAGEAELEVAYGPLVVQERSDGARILSTSHTEFRRAISGLAALEWQGGRLLGEFRAELESEGYAEGSFVIAMPR